MPEPGEPQFNKKEDLFTKEESEILKNHMIDHINKLESSKLQRAKNLGEAFEEELTKEHVKEIAFVDLVKAYKEKHPNDSREDIISYLESIEDEVKEYLEFFANEYLRQRKEEREKNKENEK